VTLPAAQISLTGFGQASFDTGLTINEKKTVGLAASNGKIHRAGTELLRLMDNKPVLSVRDFRYLGSYAAKERSDLTARLAAGWVPLQGAAKWWKSATLPVSSKITFFNALVMSIVLYGSESWVVTDDLTDRLNGAYTRMLRFAKGLDFRDHPTIEIIYDGLPSVVTYVIRKRLKFLGRALRNRVSHPSVMVDTLEYLVQQYREVIGKDGSAADNQKNGFGYIKQLYNDLDIGTGKTFRRHDFAAITKLADDVKAWTSMIDKRIRAVNAPAPVRPRVQRMQPSATVRAQVNARRHEGRAPCRSATTKLRSLCRQLAPVLTEQEQEARRSVRARLTEDF
jgi:hypothetical protein